MIELGFAETWEAIARAQPDAIAIVQGERRTSWAEFEAQAAALADYWRGCGLTPGACVTSCMRNMLEYPVAFFAAYKLGLTTFTCNYRYTPAELQYLLHDAQAEAIMFSLETVDQIARVRELMPEIKSWIAVPDGVHAVPEWATSLDAITAGKVDPPYPRQLDRPEEDRFLLYTGGTTGMPKGVIWRHVDIIAALGGGFDRDLGLGPCADIDELVSRLPIDGYRPRALIGSPLMHGAGQSAMFLTLSMGGTVIVAESINFDAVELWDAAERERATRIAIVGEAFATPMLEALEAHPGRWTQPALKSITSTGAMWSRENKAGILHHLPHLRLVDSLASSEGPPLGISTTTSGASGITGSFEMRDHCAVFTEDGRRVAPGSDEIGMLAIGGRLPLGYYGDPVKTAQTYRVIDGERWAIAGDMARVAADGSIELLGRGSQCINTGGEKVFAEEVETALKRHPGVRDALVVGLPDPRFGESIAALIEPRVEAAGPLDATTLAAHVRADLAGYKVPRTVRFTDRIPRLVNGKADLSAARALLLAPEPAPAHG
jgi:fatty-acyl-CoA synthase